MRRLMDYLPENYPASRETAAFQEALQPEADALWAARDGLLAQLDPYTATWGLDYWERALGIANAGHLGLELRRRQIAAKLQGRAATTPQVVKDTAETLLGVPVTVIERFGEYLVEVWAEAGGKLPAGTIQLKGRLRELMPAHLDWQVVIPTLLSTPTLAALGPRMATAAPPMHRPRPEPGRLTARAALGTRYSRASPPMAAGNTPLG